MGMGLIGAGAAVKGLMGGYQQGRKFAQDEERFEMEKEDFQQRKELRGLQMEGTKLSNKKAQGELDDADFDREVDAESRRIQQQYEERVRKTLGNKSYQVPQEAAGITSPMPQGMPDATAFGVTEPGATQAPASGGTAQQAQPESIFQIRQQMMVDLLSNDLRRKGANRAEILKNVMAAGRFAKTAEAQAYIDAMRDFKAGRPQQEIFADLSRQFGRDVPPGTQMVMGETPLYRGSKLMVPDVQIKLPNGQVISEDDMAAAMLTAEQTLNRKTEIGKLHAQVSHHAAMEKIQEDNNAATAARDVQQHKERLAALHASIAAQVESNRIREGAAQKESMLKEQEQFSRQAATLVGYKPLSEKDRIEIETKSSPVKRTIVQDGVSKEIEVPALQVAEEREAMRSQQVITMSLIAGMNIDPKTGRIAITPSEALAASLVSDPKKIKTDDINRKYVEVGSTRVLIPTPPSMMGQTDKPTPGPAPAPAPAPAPKPGLGGGGYKGMTFSDQQLLQAVREAGMSGYQKKLLGNRPNIRDQAAVRAYDAQAQAIADRLAQLTANKGISR